MNFSYNWLQSFFDKKLPAPNKLADILNTRLFEVEEVKKEKSDWVMNVNVLPNRGGDCLSHFGLAKECSVLLGYKLKEQKFSLKEGSKKIEDYISIDVRAKNLCPRYAARVVDGVKIATSPLWLQEKLKACGFRPINNIVDAVNYVMLETGQPLHAFDCEKLKGRRIVVRLAEKNEKIITLEGEKYNLDENVLVIADIENPVAIAGIKGGKDPEINKKTKIVVIESANFSGKNIRNSSRKIGLKTDASWRFEHGLDPSLAELAINKAAWMIQKTAGGVVAKGMIDVYSKKPAIKKITLKVNYLNSLLGMNIPLAEVKKILIGSGFKILKSSSNSFFIEVPALRTDIFCPEDLVEEVGRIYGYEKIKEVFPKASLRPALKNDDIFWENKAKDILKEAGFTEVYNYSFVSDSDADVFGEKGLIELENPISVEQKYLRPNLIIHLLKNAEKNLKNFENIKIFELGKIFKNGEERRLSGVVSGNSFYEAKGAVDALLEGMGVKEFGYSELKSGAVSFLRDRKCAEIKIEEKGVGFLGELSLKIFQKMKLEKPVIIFDIDFGKLQSSASEDLAYKPLSRFPFATRDLAVLVPKSVKVIEVLGKFNIIGGRVIKEVNLFDVYEGKNLPEGKKNLAFHIIFQSEEKTFSSAEIDEIQKKIISALEKNPGWEVRK